ncbi:MAG: hypothetical protein WAN14_20390 [Candidatus Acidiferrales bacterium]
MSTTDIEARVLAAELNRSWKSFVESTDENYEQRKSDFLSLRESIDSLDADLRAEVLRRVRG